MTCVLPDVERALCQDRSHAILVLHTGDAEVLAREVAGALRDRARVEVVPLEGWDVAWALRRISSRDAAPDDESETRARIELERLATENQSLVLVIPDAARSDPTVLRHIAHLGSRCGNALRLVLIADRGAPSDPDPVAALVQALGTGAARIDVGRARADAMRADQTAVIEAPGPPVIPRDGARRTRPIPVRTARRARDAGPSRRWLATACALAALLLAAPAVIWATSQRPGRVPLPVTAWATGGVRALLGRVTPPVATPPLRPALPLPGPESPRAEQMALVDVLPQVERPAGEAELLEQTRVPEAPAPSPDTSAAPSPTGTPASSSEPSPEPVLPPGPARTPETAPVSSAAPLETVDVSFNALPWAQIEIDARPVGATPIADVPVTVGRHRVRATFPNGRVAEQKLDVSRFEKHFRIR